MTRIEDETLIAFADGELNEIDRARVERALAADPELRERLAAHRRLRERLSAHYDPVAEEPVPERFRALLEPKVVPLRPASARPFSWQAATALAATLVVGLVLGRALPSGGPIAVDDNALVARGELAQALETQLAAAQTGDAAVRIGVTFPGPEGRFCRTFEGRTITGLACRGEENWRVMIAAPAGGGTAGEYRQAGSGSALVLQAAQEAMAGEPLDAEAERRARDADWGTD